jgi:hypothetical protein
LGDRDRLSLSGKVKGPFDNLIQVRDKGQDQKGQRGQYGCQQQPLILSRKERHPIEKTCPYSDIEQNQRKRDQDPFDHHAASFRVHDADPHRVRL